MFYIPLPPFNLRSSFCRYPIEMLRALFILTNDPFEQSLEFMLMQYVNALRKCYFCECTRVTALNQTNAIFTIKLKTCLTNNSKVTTS